MTKKNTKNAKIFTYEFVHFLFQKTLDFSSKMCYAINVGEI